MFSDLVRHFALVLTNYGFYFCLSSKRLDMDMALIVGFGERVANNWFGLGLFLLALGLATRSATLIGNFLLFYHQHMVWVILPFVGYVFNICLRVGNDGFGLPLIDFFY